MKVNYQTNIKAKFDSLNTEKLLLITPICEILQDVKQDQVEHQLAKVKDTKGRPASIVSEQTDKP